MGSPTAPTQYLDRHAEWGEIGRTGIKGDYCKFSSQAIPIALIIISFKRNTSSVLPDHHISPLPHGSYKYSAISPLIFSVNPSPPSTSSI
jgi:hypothetical protein